MKYALMRKMDISNGRNIGVSLFVQGCRKHCHNCFNPETWDFDGGMEWDDNAKETFLKLASADYVKRISILGGEPLEPENLCDILNLLKEIRQRFPDKTIWLYTGYEINQLLIRSKENNYLKYIIENIDYLVDGSFIENKKNISLSFRGSANQHILKKVRNRFVDVSSEFDTK